MRHFKKVAELLTIIEHKKEIIFIDETALNIGDFQKNGWYEKGKIANVKQIGKQKRISIITAISTQDHYFYLLKSGSVNHVDFLGFFQNYLKALKLETRNLSDYRFYYENTRCLIDKRVVEKYGNEMNLIYSPPYSPFLQPVEELFGVWKREIKQNNCENMNEFIKVIYLSSKQITASHIRYFI